MTRFWRSSAVFLAVVVSLGAASVCAEEDAARTPADISQGDDIDLERTLALAGANNLDLSIAREVTKQAEAVDLQATLKLFPYLTVGSQYAGHKGAVANANGVIIHADKEAYGQNAAIVAQLNLGDAIAQKFVAHKLSAGASAAETAQQKTTVLNAASGYFDLVGAAADAGIAREALRISQDYQDQLSRAVKIGFANQSDALRVQVQTQSYQIALRQDEERLHVAAAALAQILHISAPHGLVPHDAVPVPVTLVPSTTKVEDLTAQALAARPELLQSQATIDAADWARLGATYGPLLPSVSAGYSSGTLRGGPDGAEVGSRGVNDTTVMLNWRIGAGGLLDVGRINEADAKLQQTRYADAKLRDDITRQVVQNFEAVHSAQDQIALARAGVENATQALDLAKNRREFGVAGVLEMIQSQQQLVQARRDLNRATTQNNKAQYALAYSAAFQP